MAEPVGSVRVEVSAGTAKFEAGMKKARATARANGLKIEKSFSRMQKRSLAASRSLTSFRSGLVAIGGATAFLGLMRKAISSSVKLEKGLREVGTLMGGLSKNEMKAMGDELKNISIQTGQALDKLVKAKYDIISAGFDGIAESAKLMAASADLAVAGVTEVSTAADLLTTTLNAYNLTADDAVDISDKLFATVRLGKTTIQEMAGSLGRVLGVAGTLGIDLDELLGSFATLTTTMGSSKRATTALLGTINAMLTPTKDLRAIVKDLGFKNSFAMIQQLGFADSIQVVADRAKALKIPLTDVFSSLEGLQGILPLTGTAAGRLAESIDGIGGASGDVKVAVKEMAKSTDLQLKRMGQAFVVLSQTIADPFLPAIADAAATAIANGSPAVVWW